MTVGGQRHAPAALPPGKRPATIVQEAGWNAEPVWTGAENLACNGIRSPNRPARSESLYRLSYPSPPYRKISQQNLSAAKLLPAITFLIIYTEMAKKK
jgi:hypothetical protein